MRQKRPTVWALGFAAVTMLLRLPFLGLPFDPRDEGYYAAVARATVRGGRLYADLWYVRPPFLNLAYAWSYRFSLGTHMPYDLSVRLFATLFAVATVGFVARALFAEFSPRAAILGSSLVALMAASVSLQYEANAETWMMLPYALSPLLVLYVALRDVPTRRALWMLALTGALTGVAAAFKQVALVNVALPIAAWAVFDRVHVRRWLARTAAFVGGTLAIWAGILLGLGVTDDVRAFFYYAWFRNVQYIQDSHSGMNALRTLVASLDGPLIAFTLSGVVVLAVFGISLARRQGLSGSKRISLFTLAWLCLSAIGVAASGRFYQHYFIQATVPLALLLSASVDGVLTSGKRMWTAWPAFALIAALVLIAPALSWVADLRAQNSTFAQRQAFKEVAERDLPRITAPGGTFLVWGISVSVKAYCPLKSASRLPVVCYDYGWSPVNRGRFLGEEFPSSADVVLPELRRAPPDTIVLTVPLNLLKPSGPSNDGIRLTNAFYALVAEHYGVVERGAGYTVLKRKS